MFDAWGHFTSIGGLQCLLLLLLLLLLLCQPRNAWCQLLSLLPTASAALMAAAAAGSLVSTNSL
jgi:hypothetical protein